jgi:hypothetical protein
MRLPGKAQYRKLRISGGEGEKEEVRREKGGVRRETEGGE